MTAPSIRTRFPFTPMSGHMEQITQSCGGLESVPDADHGFVFPHDFHVAGLPTETGVGEQVARPAPPAHQHVLPHLGAPRQRFLAGRDAPTHADMTGVEPVSPDLTGRCSAFELHAIDLLRSETEIRTPVSGSRAQRIAAIRSRIGPLGRIRTCNRRLRKPMLYPLSYEQWWTPQNSILDSSMSSAGEPVTPLPLNSRVLRRPVGGTRTPSHPLWRRMLYQLSYHRLPVVSDTRQP